MEVIKPHNRKIKRSQSFCIFCELYDLSVFVCSNHSGFYRLYKKPKENYGSFQKFLQPFCILIGCKKASRNFRTNHSVGSRLSKQKELSRNSRLNKHSDILGCCLVQ